MTHNRRHNRKNKKNNDYGQLWEIAASLSDGPLTREEIMDHFRSYLRLLGMFNIAEKMQWSSRKNREGHDLDAQLERLLDKEWAVKNDDKYSLTDLGRIEAQKVINDMKRTQKILISVQDPQFVSKVSLAAHLSLALIKLPAGLISGSIGLINDAVDTLLDGLSSILVYFGIKHDKEKQVNAILVLVMLITGGFTFYEAVKRILYPTQPEVDLFTFFAAIISAVVCALLGLYQRLIGVNKGSLALITQSIDSRNHVIVAASVCAGLIASRLNFNILDAVVGLVVSALILKSAVELAIEVIRSLGEEEIDVSHYKLGILNNYETFRHQQLRDWMLYLVETNKNLTRESLLREAFEVNDLSKNPTLRALGLGKTPEDNTSGEACLDELFNNGWVEGEELLIITKDGKEYLSKQTRTTHAGRKRRHKMLDQRQF